MKNKDLYSLMGKSFLGGAAIGIGICLITSNFEGVLLSSILAILSLILISINEEK